MKNNAYEKDSNDDHALESCDTKGKTNGHSNSLCDEFVMTKETIPSTPDRESWGKGIEFLMSCIAMSVGLGNVWRFPFTALENGGGAFLLPYIIVLLVIGRPLYYLEMVIGQFSSRNSINVFDMSPFFRGSGIGQIIAIFMLSTYYASLMALIGRYLYDSFQSPLPWSVCKQTWINCTDTSGNKAENGTSSAELYFRTDVLNEIDNIDNGIGTPILNLSIFLLIAWLFIAVVLIKGIRSSGKASYFLALFPYVIIAILLVRAVTLDGAWNGIIYFIQPKWDQILKPSVWYAAVIQCFFSLAVGFGNLIMYSSFNKFGHNVYRDATIVTTLDTFTSLFAGCTIFGILGHLAHEMGIEDISHVVRPGPGLAFISYPEAIARFQVAQQAFSVLFFFMLFVLGIGSNIAMCSCIITIVRDKFPALKAWQASIGLAMVGFSFGLIYVTPGGQAMLNLVDSFGASFIVFILVIGEVIAVCWIYGVNRLCRDIEFMINIKPGLYWRICWGFLMPILMIIILIYTFATYEPLTYNEKQYPNWAYALGWTVSAIGVIQLPLWATYAVLGQKGSSFGEKFCKSMKPQTNWGPKDPEQFARYQKYVTEYEQQQTMMSDGNILVRFKRHIFG